MDRIVDEGSPWRDFALEGRDIIARLLRKHNSVGDCQTAMFETYIERKLADEVKVSDGATA